MDSVQALRAVPLFANVSHGLLQRLGENAQVAEYAAGKVISRQGDPPKHILAIVEGRVGMIGLAVGGAETVVEIFGAGNVLWTPSAILDRPYVATARAITPATVIFVPADAYRAGLDEDHAVARATAYMLAEHTRTYAHQIKELKLKTADQRLAAYLCSLSEHSKGLVSVNIPIERRLLAGLLGMTPESLSRAFAGLRVHGVTGRGRRIQIADLARLHDYGREDDLF